MTTGVHPPRPHLEFHSRRMLRVGFCKGFSGDLLRALVISDWRLSTVSRTLSLASFSGGRRWNGPEPWNGSIPMRRMFRNSATSDAPEVAVQRQRADLESLMIGEHVPQRKVINLPDPEYHDGQVKRPAKKRRRRKSAKLSKKAIKDRRGRVIPRTLPKYAREFPHAAPSEEFLMKVRELNVFKLKYMDLNVPKTLWDNQELGLWVADQKKRYTLKWMSIEEKALLDSAGFVWKKNVNDAEWHMMLHEARRFYAVFNNLDVPMRWKSDDWPAVFPRWWHQQHVLFQQRRLSTDKVVKLRVILGHDLKKIVDEDISDEKYDEEYKAQLEAHGGGQNVMDFEIMMKHLAEWKEKYYTCHVPRRVHDASVLGEWVHRLRRKYKKKLLDEWQIRKLNEMAFEWKVHQLDARWYSLYHHLRRYKAKHKTVEFPEAFNDPDEPNWMEASRWMERQHKLFFKQKLSPHRVQLLKDLGVPLDKPYGPLKINPMIQEADPIRYKKLREKHEELLRKRKKLEKRQAKQRKEDKIKEMERQELLNWYLPFGDPRFR